MRHMKPGSPLLCPTELTLKVIGGGWKIGIIGLLNGKRRRYSELRRKLPGISPRVLAKQLRELERHGILSRTVHPEVPPRVEYELSRAGRSLVPILQALFDWGKKHQILAG
jgi:DNA-binding HxlR family transcriptional regulator